METGRAEILVCSPRCLRLSHCTKSFLTELYFPFPSLSTWFVILKSLKDKALSSLNAPMSLHFETLRN